MNLVTLHFSSAVRCQFYMSYLEEMQTSLRGLRRAGGGGVTKDTPKENVGKGLSQKREADVFILSMHTILL